MSEQHATLKQITVSLEDELLEALEELAEQYAKEMGQRWSRGAVIRLALSECFRRRGRIV